MITIMYCELLCSSYCDLIKLVYAHLVGSRAVMHPDSFVDSGAI